MSKTNNGGSAFPYVYETADKYGRVNHVIPGMDLRDYFAGQALMGIVTMRSGNPVADAKLAYRLADAMMETREEKEDVVPADVIDALWNAGGGEYIKDICERVLQKFPTLTKEQILFNYSVNELLKMLGEEPMEVVVK